MNPAISKTQGPCIILAGAGTGKTHTIVEKIQYLINNKIYPAEKIVCLTFSNEAANSLKIRNQKSLSEKDKEPVISTFHSFCVEILRKHGQKIDIKDDFKILLPDDAKILIHKNLNVPPINCHQYINAVGTAKDLGITPKQIEQYLEKNQKEISIQKLEKSLENFRFRLQTLYTKNGVNSKEKEELKEKIETITKLLKTQKFLKAWCAYEKLKVLKNFLDYSDLNKNALDLLKKHPEISKEYEYIIVDEFQDTNKLQCDFLEAIAPHKNITIVGDLNQSIYRFRGAYKNNLNNFKKSFNTSKEDIFTLDKSYRSTNNILEAAHKLILNNYKNKEECFSVFSVFNKEGEKSKAYELKDSKEEVRKIIEIIKSEIASGTPAEEICVLFRTHQQSRLLKNSLEFEKIPYTSVTKKSLTRTMQVKVTEDYLTILSKLKNKKKGGEQAWWDLIHNSSFSKSDAILISKFIKEHKNSENLSIKLLNFLSDIPLTQEGKTKARLLLKRIKSLLPELEKPVPELILKIYEIAGLNSQINNKENFLVLKKFHELAQEHSQLDSPDLENFLRHLTIMNNLGIQIEAPVVENSGIRIMTHHATKGLEYETVIVSNLAQNRFPMIKPNSSVLPSELSPEISEIIKNLPEQEKSALIKDYEQKNQLLEERRLCYVAFTRAKNKLFLTYSKKYGNRNFLPSQFLNEIHYKQNSKIEFFQDFQEKYREPKNEISDRSDINKIINSKNPEELIINPSDKNKKEAIFSPSALQTFSECQKKYEYKYIYNMPEPVPVSWEAMKLGSFVHLVCEKGVKENLQTEKQFLDLTKALQLDDKWNFVELEEVFPLIRVFFHRNKNKYSKNSLTEKKLYANLDGLKFVGIADRIDINSDGKNELEIIDYKTGSSEIKPKYRNWQLGFYALAAKSLGVPKRLTLEMLKKEKPIEFDLDEKGNATEIHSKRTFFNLEEVKQDLIQTAKQILSCHENGFSPCPIEKNCDFCDEYVRGLS